MHNQLTGTPISDTEYETITGPSYVAEIDLIDETVIGAHFDTREEMIAFVNKHPGNRSETFIPAGREYTYVRRGKLPAGTYKRWAEELERYGTTE